MWYDNLISSSEQTTKTTCHHWYTQWHVVWPQIDCKVSRSNVKKIFKQKKTTKKNKKYEVLNVLSTLVLCKGGTFLNNNTDNRLEYLPF